MQRNSTDFKDFINNNYYIDKTLFIEDLITKGNQSMLFARPKGFGKTLNLSMLKYYFDIRENSRDLFKGLKIEKSSVFEKHLNKYPTIYLTFKEIKSLSSWDQIYNAIKNIISNLYKEHKYLLESFILDNYDKEVINKIIRGDADLCYYKNSLSMLTEYLHEHYNRRVLVLLDDHDILVNPFYDEKTYKNVSNFLSVLMSSTFKGNEHLFMGIITGVFKIPVSSIFSGANNIDNVNILDNRFSDKFGFTENEVLDALKRFKMKEKIEEVREWYGGYLFGKDHIYNPFSIIRYLEHKELKSYWINNDPLIKNLLINSSSSIKADLQKLMKGDSVGEYIEQNIIFSEPNRYFWSILLYSGYLKAERITYRIYILSIPNRETQSLYEDISKYIY